MDAAREVVLSTYPEETALNPGDIHYIDHSMPKATPMIPSHPLTPPSASAEATAMAYVTPPPPSVAPPSGLFTFPTPRVIPLPSTPEVAPMVLDEPKELADPQEAAQGPSVLIPGTPPSMRYRA
ncbi:hypothetical protein FRC06_003036 [Ceratobasidium sp. 370]|nr:hypothetical protein FRC06_003036 [Ceratobasidium sp. 370]